MILKVTDNQYGWLSLWQLGFLLIHFTTTNTTTTTAQRKTSKYVPYTGTVQE